MQAGFDFLANILQEEKARKSKKRPAPSEQLAGRAISLDPLIRNDEVELLSICQIVTFILFT